MSNDQWYLTDGQQQQHGPVPFAQIQEWAASGHVQPENLVWHEGLGDWTEAGQVEGIFQQAAPAPVAPVAPAAPVAPVGAANLFAPTTQAGPAASSGTYPFPTVGKTSFNLYLFPPIIAIVVFIVVIVIGGAALPSEPDLSRDKQRLEAATSGEESKKIEAEMQKKLDAYNQEAATTSLISGGIGLVALLAASGLSIFSTIYGYIILHRAWHILQPGGARTTPGAAVGMMFIPLFNIYWVFNVYVGWATDWNRIRSSHRELQAAPAASTGLIITALIFLFSVILSPIGIILFWMARKQMCDTINFFAWKKSGPASQPTGSVPQFY